MEHVPPGAQAREREEMDDVTAARKHLIRSVGTAKWLAEKREEYPDDHRNADAIRELRDWMQKTVHMSLLIRPKAKNEWGGSDPRTWAQHFLQGLPGIGPDRALALFNHFGRVPMAWDCSQEDLEAVSGIGKMTGNRLWEALA